MVWDPQFSPQEAELFYVLAGSRPPLANRDKMLATRDAFLQAQQAVVSQLTPEVARLVTRSLLGLDGGATAESFVTSMESLSSAPPYYLPSLADQYQQVADYIDTTADEFLRMKVDSIMALAALLVTIAIDLAFAVFFPEIGLAAIAAEFVIVRFLLSTLIGRLIMHLIMAAVMSVAIQEALDVIGQIVVNAELHQDWNWQETAMQAEVGLLGGAMGLVLMPVDHMLGEFLGNALVKGADVMLGTFGTELGDVGRDVVHAAGEFTAGALVGGVHNAGHATLFNGMTGNGWSWDWGSFSGGAAQGVAGIVAAGLAAGFKMATMVATLPVDQLLVRGLNESISPAILNDIAAYRPPPPDGGHEAGAEVAPGAAAVPRAVAVLNALDVLPGPETAYAIALRTGFVPIVGEPSENPLWEQSLTAQVPMEGFLVPGQTGPVLPGEVIAQPGPVAALPAGQQTIHEPTTPEPVTPPATQQPVTGQPVIGEQLAGQPVTQQPVTQQPVTQQPATQEPVVQAGGQPQVAGESVAGPPVTGQVPQAGSVGPGQQALGGQEAVQPGHDPAGGQPVPQEPGRLSETSGGLPAPARVRVPDAGGAGAGHEAASDGTALVSPGRSGREMAAGPGSEATGLAGPPPLRPEAESVVPGVLGDAGGPDELPAAGTRWVRGDGWHVSQGTGTARPQAWCRRGAAGGGAGGGVEGGVQPFG